MAPASVPASTAARRRVLVALALLTALATTLSCAVTDAPDTYAPADASASPPLQSAARFGLAPAYRGFYDALEGEGDWTLIEPYGWVFRPKVNFDSWRPYQEGWWEPSDAFGWIWYSNDPFGWITDHYGAWFYDSFQGWVWQPGPVWGPAWVAWVSVGDYLGWAPLGPPDYDGYADAPGGVFTFAGARQFDGMSAASTALFVMRPPVANQPVREIANYGRRAGVTYNRGPDPALIARLGGGVPSPLEEPAVRRVKLPDLRPPAEGELFVRTRRAVEAGARVLGQARVEVKPPVVIEPRTKSPEPAPLPQIEPRTKHAPADSTRAPRQHGKAPRRAPGKPPRPGAEPGHAPAPHGAEPDTTKG